MSDEPRLSAAWPTLVWARGHDQPELNRELVTLARRISAETATPGGTYFFTRRKVNCFRDYPDAALRALARLAFAGVRDYLARAYDETAAPQLEISGYPMVQPYGHGVPAHHHIGSHLAAVYYCAVPPLPADPPIGNSGHLILHDPRPVNRDWEPAGRRLREFKYFEIAVAAGLMVIFPGYVMHSVQPWYGDDPRVCYAMNIMVHRAQLHEPGIAEEALESRHG